MVKLTCTPIYLASIVWLCLQKSLPCTTTEMHETLMQILNVMDER